MARPSLPDARKTLYASKKEFLAKKQGSVDVQVSYCGEANAHTSRILIPHHNVSTSAWTTQRIGMMQMIWMRRMCLTRPMTHFPPCMARAGPFPYQSTVLGAKAKDQRDLGPIRARASTRGSSTSTSTALTSSASFHAPISSTARSPLIPTSSPQCSLCSMARCSRHSIEPLGHKAARSGSSTA